MRKLFYHASSRKIDGYDNVCNGVEQIGSSEAGEVLQTCVVDWLVVAGERTVAEWSENDSMWKC
jgi:hypothetical protein